MIVAQEVQAELAIPPEYVPDPRNVVRLSWSPRAFLYKNFLSSAECDYIVNVSRPHMKRSTVVGPENKGVVDDIRTSSGTFLDKYEDPVIYRIEQRIGAWTFLPLENQEAMQVLKYQLGQEYRAHHDYYKGKEDQTGGPRYATVLMYLSDVEAGGETVFPNSEKDTVVKDDTWSECGKKGVAVKPRKGDTLLFFGMNPDASFDVASMHAGCPVIKGEKWSATKWIHESSNDPPHSDPTVCQDDNENCKLWAKVGECEKNPKYMIGSRRSPLNMGFCRKSCNACLSQAELEKLNASGFFSH